MVAGALAREISATNAPVAIYVGRSQKSKSKAAGGGARDHTSTERHYTCCVSTAPMVEIQGRQLKLSNLDKVLYPATGFTKGQVIDYYARIGQCWFPIWQDGR